MSARDPLPTIAVCRARKLAAERRENYAVIDVEHEEGRTVIVRPESWLNYDEALAFDARCLAIVAPDGSID